MIPFFKEYPEFQPTEHEPVNGEADNVEVGDTVRLRGGGPLITVNGFEQVGPRIYVTGVYYNSVTGVFQHTSILASLLVKESTCTGFTISHE